MATRKPALDKRAMMVTAVLGGTAAIVTAFAALTSVLLPKLSEKENPNEPSRGPTPQHQGMRPQPPEPPFSEASDIERSSSQRKVQNGVLNIGGDVNGDISGNNINAK